MAIPILSAVVFIALVALLYGVTIAPSPRLGVQPVEFMDEAYYAVLGADLAETATETIYSPSGFTELPGLPKQTWYHWGEIWLAASVITVGGLDPMAARHFVVLPLILLAAVALVGTIVRRASRTDSRVAFVIGAACCLFLAPFPIPGPFFSSWASGLVFGITLYGLSVIPVLLGIYILVKGRYSGSWACSIFVGGVAASIIPAHLVIAALAFVGAGSAALARIVGELARRRRLPGIGPHLRRMLVALFVASVVTAMWGTITGHGLGANGLSDLVEPFNSEWLASVLLTGVGAGAFLAIPLAWILIRQQDTRLAPLFVGTMALLAVGAVAWGARIGDFNMFHVFYGGIAVLAMPVAAIAIRLLWQAAAATGHRRIATALVLITAVQLEVGVASSTFRLYLFGPHDYEPIPVTILDEIKMLPQDAKLAYSCLPFEEVAFWDPKLVSITAHTGRRIVPMCFQAEIFGALTGGDVSQEAPSPLFEPAPQRELFPSADEQPSRATLTEFLRRHGIGFIYSDVLHPNRLVPEAVPIAFEGTFRILKAP